MNDSGFFNEPPVLASRSAGLTLLARQTRTDAELSPPRSQRNRLRVSRGRPAEAKKVFLSADCLRLKIIAQEVADHINQSNDDFYSRVFEGIESERHDVVIGNFEKLVRAMHRQQDRLNKK
jgi:5'-deoxynucleotidase YfbR-like HD superfamily hydrolase